MTLHHLRSLHSVWPVLGALGDCELMLASDCSTYLGRRKNIHIRLKTVRDRQGASSSVSRGISESTLINTTSRSRLPIVVGNLYHEQTARCCGLVPWTDCPLLWATCTMNRLPVVVSNLHYEQTARYCTQRTLLVLYKLTSIKPLLGVNLNYSTPTEEAASNQLGRFPPRSEFSEPQFHYRPH